MHVSNAAFFVFHSRMTTILFVAFGLTILYYKKNLILYNYYVYEIMCFNLTSYHGTVGLYLDRLKIYSCKTGIKYIFF